MSLDTTTVSKPPRDSISHAALCRNQFLSDAQNADPRLAIRKHPVRSLLAAAAVGAFIAFEAPSSNQSKHQGGQKNNANPGRPSQREAASGTGIKLIRLSQRLSTALQFAARFALPLADHFASGFASAQQARSKNRDQSDDESTHAAQHETERGAHARTNHAKDSA